MSLAMRICEGCCRKMSEFYTLTEYLEEPERDRVCQMCGRAYKGRLLYIVPKRKSGGKGK